MYEETFDERYSTEVSLSRILDYFLLTDEKPSTVVSFLKLHKDSVPSIFNYSDCYPKIFQIDFIRELVGTEVDFIFDLFKYVPKSVRHMLLCQVIYRRGEYSEFDDIFVGKCVRLLRSLLEDRTVRHKYAGRNGRYGQMLDSAFMTGLPASYIAEHFSSDAFARLIPYLSNSIYEGRILQMDFYENLSPINKRVLLGSMKYADSELVTRFVKQFLTYNTDANEKYELFRAVKFGHLWHPPAQFTSDESMARTVDELRNCDNYPEFAIRSTVIGMDDSRDLIFQMLFTTDLKVLFEMLEMDRDKLDGMCRISDLLQCLKDDFENGGIGKRK